MQASSRYQGRVAKSFTERLQYIVSVASTRLDSLVEKFWSLLRGIGKG